MTQGYFYFISDNFYTKHDSYNQLMQNKDGPHGRPCFYCFPDSKDPDILWCIPISSQVEKYKKIVQKKLQRQLERGIQKPKCNTIRFGDVLGQSRAFLIQNMFPITEKYIDHLYLDKNTKNPVTIPSEQEKDIITNAKETLKLVQYGYRELVFSDIIKTREELINELHTEK